MSARPPRTDFGTDDPAKLTALIGSAVACLLIGLFLTGGGARLLAAVPLVAFAVLSTAAYSRARASSLTKRRLWDALLDDLALAGTETALDVGCGRGLVLAGLAQRLPHGRAIGVDRWRTREQSGNHPAATEATMRLLGVDGRTEVRTGDARTLPLEDASVDVATAGLILDHLDGADRRLAVDELLRVLRPGGRLVAVDHRRLDDVLDQLRVAGCAPVRAWRQRGGPPYPAFHAIVATTPPVTTGQAH